MATVIIHRTDATIEILTDVDEADTAQYQSLPFTDETVISTEITL